MGALNKYTFLGIVLILVSVGVRAGFTSGGFELEGDCFKAVFASYEFTNNWTETITYKLTAIGDGAEWVNINGKWISEEPLAFTLKPGEKKILYAYFKPCCWTNPGEYIIGLQYSSKKGIKTQQITFLVKESRVLSIDVIPPKIEIGQCEEGVFEVKVTNRSQIGETIGLSIEGLEPEWLELSSNEFFLGKDSEKTVQLSVTPKCTDALKEYNGKIIAKIKNTELFTSKDFNVEIVDKQLVEIGTEEQRSLDACNDLEEEKIISIKNNGRAKDVLSLSISGPEWIELKEKTLSLEPGETKSISVYFHSRGIEETNYSFTLKAFSEIYGKETVQEFTVSVEDCFRLEVEKIRGVEESCLEEGLSYEFSVWNVKETETSVKVTLNGMSAEVSPESFKLDANEEKRIRVSFDLSEESKGEKKFTLVVEADNFEFLKEFALKLNDCYALELENQELVKKIEVVTGAQVCPQEKIITLLAKNPGTMSQEITVNISGIEWVFVEPKELALNPDEFQEFYLYFSPPVNIKEGNYTGTLEVIARDFQEKIPMNVSIKTIGPEEEIDVSAESELEEEIIETKKTIKAKIKLKNTGNCRLGVNDIKAAGYDVSFDSTSFELDVNEERTIVATVFLGEDFNEEKVSFPITIETDRGIIKKMLSISLVEEEVVVEEIGPEAEETVEEVTEEEASEEAPTGFAALGAKTVNLVVLLFLAIVAIVIVILAYHAYKKPAKPVQSKKTK